jgi:hypothetical protein
MVDYISIVGIGVSVFLIVVGVGLTRKGRAVKHSGQPSFSFSLKHPGDAEPPKVAVPVEAKQNGKTSMLEIVKKGLEFFKKEEP